jgi:hypothetical protein
MRYAYNTYLSSRPDNPESVSDDVSQRYSHFLHVFSTTRVTLKFALAYICCQGRIQFTGNTEREYGIIVVHTNAIVDSNGL